MAAGAQIIISADGITIKTPKKFKVFATQHQFSHGEAVTVAQTTLPNPISRYSNKFDYSIQRTQSCSNQALKSYVIHQHTGQLLAYQCSDQAQISSQRFHTDQPQPVIGLLYLSDQITATQNNPIDQHLRSDPLVEEALGFNLDNLDNLDHFKYSDPDHEV